MNIYISGVGKNFSRFAQNFPKMKWKSFSAIQTGKQCMENMEQLQFIYKCLFAQFCNFHTCKSTIKYNFIINYHKKRRN